MRLSGAVHRLRYFVADAWDEWRHSPGVNLLALATLVASLFVAGLVLLLITNVERRVQLLRGDVRLQVFLRDAAGERERATLEHELAAEPGVTGVAYVDKAEAARRYRQWAAGLAELVDELAANPLPAALEVSLAPGPGALDTASRLAAELGNRAGVEEVRFDEAWLGKLESLLDLARFGSIGVVAIVLGSVIFVMAAVLRLAVHARREEIQIMELVGATPAFIRGPFLVAGLAQGVIGSVLALAVLEGLRRTAWLTAPPGMSVLLDLVVARPLSAGLSVLVMLVGVAVGLASAHFAVRQPG